VTESPTDVTLRHVREDVAAMRGDISGLAAELRAHMQEQGPRIAVFEHRLADVEQDVETVRQVLQGNTAERTRGRWGIATAITVAALSWVPNVITLISK
jgi:hypothetical protein